MYTKEQYESDKAVIESAPNGTTHSCQHNGTFYQFRLKGLCADIFMDGSWNLYTDCALPDLDGVSLLQDIRDKIELYEQLAESEKLRIESIEAWSSHLDKAQAKIELLEGIKPELPPRPPTGILAPILPRYGIKFNGENQPLTTPMLDGYWTPYHIAQAKIDEL
jgi:hypothetical protein